VLASPRFQRWAASTPLIRRIGERQARRLFDLCAGFVYSQVLVACVRLGVFELLAEGPRTCRDLAARWRLSEAAAGRLLDAAVSLDLLERRGNESYGLGLLGAALRGNPGVAAMIEHHALLYDDLRDPVALLRRDGPTRLANFWTYAGATPGAAVDVDEAERLAAMAMRDYTRLMSSSQHLVAVDILDAYPLQRHRCLLDIGGGDGSFAMSAVSRAPQLRAIVVDLPEVVALAQQRIDAGGLAGRIAVAGLDARVDRLPTGADVASLVRVIHDHDDGPALALLRAAHAALAPGGTLLLAEPMAATAGAEPMGAAYFGLYLWAMGSGRPRRFEELAQLATAAGFHAPQEVAVRRPLLTRMLRCSRAA
jgi:demethylspheroidene O-methyltransferase